MASFSRLSRLGALTTRVGSSYLGQTVSGLFKDQEGRKAALDRLHLENAERIVSQLGALKGAAMKVGQQVAQLADNYGLPEEARAVLGRLHDSVEPVPFAQVRARVEAELHGDLGALFRSFDPAPLGTASLGQAHAAELPDGTRVVVKVLHADVEGSVKSDLSALKAMLQAGRFLRRPKEEVDAIFEEIGARLAEELDYRAEAANLDHFAAALADDPDVRVPRPLHGWSTGRVLTMERLEGRPIGVFAPTASEAARQRAGAALARTFLRMQYVHRALHADPHPGNYLFTPDGRVGILDFGCVRRFDTRWMATYGRCGLATRLGDKEACMSAADAIGALSERAPDSPDEDALWDLCRAIGKPFAGGPFTMGGPEDDVQDRVTAIMPRIVTARRLRAPRELVFLHRGLGGMHHLLRTLHARADWGEMFVSAHARCASDADALDAG
jgi:predicted unusual protein kinase regulating ubiquinone biosynthesis (AarF/ABC1/UbiB family)